MRIIAIPDIHGESHWKKVIPLVDTADKIVFLGDFFDSWSIKFARQFVNAKDIIAFKRQYSDKVCLCWANHDTSYYLDERCSGFQYEHFVDIYELFKENKDLFEVCYIFGNWIFSHGGISYKWMRSNKIKDVREINQLFREKPYIFEWAGPDAYGNNSNESPLWIRYPMVVRYGIDNYHQCIGHTEREDFPHEFNIRNKAKLVCIDTMQHDKIIEIDTDDNYWKII